MNTCRSSVHIKACAQAALPFKSKPKVEVAGRRPPLERRRSVVMEPGEKRAVSLLAQLNALRNAKAVTRRASNQRHREVWPLPAERQQLH